MRRAKKPTRKLPLIATGILALLVLATAYIVYTYNTHRWPFIAVKNPASDTSNISYQEPTKEQLSTGNQTKDHFITSTTEATEQSKAESQPRSGTGTDPHVISVGINSNQQPSNLAIRAIIGTIDDSGTCSLVMTRSGSSTITKSAKTQTMGSYTTCTGFDINTVDIDKGTWHIVLTYDGSNNRSGSIAKDITIQ